MDPTAVLDAVERIELLVLPGLEPGLWNPSTSHYFTIGSILVDTSFENLLKAAHWQKQILHLVEQCVPDLIVSQLRSRDRRQ